jgi:hypothetical protein
MQIYFFLFFWSKFKVLNQGFKLNLYLFKIELIGLKKNNTPQMTSQKIQTKSLFNCGVSLVNPLQSELQTIGNSSYSVFI